MKLDLLIRVLVTTAAAALLSKISAPANWHAVHWIAYLPFFWVLRAETPREDRWYAFLYGTVAVGVIFAWVPHTISVFSNIPDLGARVLGLLFDMAFGLPYFAVFAAVHPLRKRLGDLWIVALPAWLVIVEYTSMYVILFPYNQGVSQFGNPYTWQLASVTGVWGLSYLVLFVNCAFGEALYRHREGRPMPLRWAASAVSVLSLVVIFGVQRYNRIEAELRTAPTLTYQQIQVDTTMQHRMSSSRNKTLDDWLSESRKIPPGSVDLVVWSEGASPGNVHEGPIYDILSPLIAQGGYEMLVGGGTLTIHYDEQGKPLRTEAGKVDYEAYNSVYLFNREGKVAGRYDKTVPLPFGEYLPLSGVFPWLNDLIEGPGNFRAGPEVHDLQGATYAYATPICYEAILPSVCLRFPAPDLLVNVTNDAWFTGAATFQHGMLAAVRATELGVPLLRAAYTGTSFVVEPHGVIYAQTPSFERVNRPVTIRMAHFETFYARFGDWFVLVCGLGLAGLAARYRLKAGA